MKKEDMKAKSKASKNWDKVKGTGQMPCSSKPDAASTGAAPSQARTGKWPNKP